MAAAPVSSGTARAGRGAFGERLAAAAAMGAKDFACEEAIDVGVSGATGSGNAPVGVGVSARVVAAMRKVGGEGVVVESTTRDVEGDSKPFQMTHRNGD